MKGEVYRRDLWGSAVEGIGRGVLGSMGFAGDIEPTKIYYSCQLGPKPPKFVCELIVNGPPEGTWIKPTHGKEESRHRTAAPLHDAVTAWT
jgi:hypothetical protein